MLRKRAQPPDLKLLPTVTFLAIFRFSHSQLKQKETAQWTLDYTNLAFVRKPQGVFSHYSNIPLGVLALTDNFERRGLGAFGRFKPCTTFLNDHLKKLVLSVATYRSEFLVNQTYTC